LPRKPVTTTQTTMRASHYDYALPNINRRLTYLLTWRRGWRTFPDLCWSMVDRWPLRG